MHKPINPLPKFAQLLLLRAYKVAQGCGFLSTPLGNRVFERAYHLYKEWLEAKAVDRLRPWVNSDSTVIDVGANAGFFTRRFAKWVSDSGQVLAIEPEARNIERLERVLAEDGISHHVHVVQAVAAETAGTLMLEINPIHPGDHRIGNTGIPVTAISLDNLVEEYNWPQVSLIKVDVQGAEVRVLDGARRVLERCRPALFLEVDPAALESQNSSVSDLVDRLRTSDYDAYAINRKKEFERISLDDVASMMGTDNHYIDILCLPKDSGARAPETHDRQV